MNNINTQTIQYEVNRLIKERGWEIYHTPDKVVPALMVECSELLDCCLWQSSEEVNRRFVQHDEKIVKEIADIAINLYSLINYCKLDINEIVKNKVDELLERYSELEKGEHR